MPSSAAPSAKFWSTSADLAGTSEPDERRCGRRSKEVDDLGHQGYQLDELVKIIEDVG